MKDSLPTALPREEPRWHASLAVIGALALYIALPSGLRFGPIWVAPMLVLLVLVPLSIISPHRHRETSNMRGWSIGLIAIVNFFNAASVVLLVHSVFHPTTASAHTAGVLMRHGINIWVTNILVFALWFWELDGGGPEVRAHAPSAQEFTDADFLFPQMQLQISGKGLACIDANWKPRFLDYVYLAFTNSTAFSPTDVMPLSRWAKMLMMVEALISLVTIAIVLARAISLIQ